MHESLEYRTIQQSKPNYNPLPPDVRESVDEAWRIIESEFSKLNRNKTLEDETTEANNTESRVSYFPFSLATSIYGGTLGALNGTVDAFAHRNFSFWSPEELLVFGGSLVLIHTGLGWLGGFLVGSAVDIAGSFCTYLEIMGSDD